VTLTLSQLAHLVGGSIVRGEPDRIFDGIASLNEAGPSEISFLGNEKYRPQFFATRAGVVILPPGYTEGPEGVALVACENPSFAFSQAVSHFTQAFARRFTPGIHPKAVIDDAAVLNPEKVRIHAGAVVMAGAVIGDGTEIFPNSVVGENVKIGQGCLIYSNVTIRERCILGDRVILQPGAVIGSDGYGYEVVQGRHVKIDQVGIVEIQNDVEIGANTTIDRARFGRTVIGEGTKIDNQVQIAHNVRIGKHNLLVAQTGIAGSSSTGDYVIIAAQAGVVGHVHIGDKAILSARTGVNSSLEGGVTYGGAPARPMMEEQRIRVLTKKLPELYQRIKDVEKKLNS
jgi:UDP-3-O-[3-hydroxymyristoyl] glucosamine N-acyltransferase